MVESVAIGIFVFVALVVAGSRALATLEKAREAAAAERVEKVRRRARPGYTGPLYNAHGREVR